MFSSSGGAFTGLALIRLSPDLATTVIAHEPPLTTLLADPEAERSRTEDTCRTYLSGRIVDGWRKFLDQAGIALPPEQLEQCFGPDRDPHTLADELYWFARELRPTTLWHPDLDALDQVSDRITVGVGADSTGQFADRAARALASALLLKPKLFPGDHTGFIDEPGAFANILREAARPGS